MVNSSLGSHGVKVVLATSSDESHPAENIIDRNPKTFWMTTGMFPQEFIFRFPEPTQVTAVTLHSYNVKHLKIEKNSSQHTSQFEFVTEKEFESTEGHLQSNSISLNGCSATHLRFIITSGYDHFVSVHNVSLES